MQTLSTQVTQHIPKDILENIAALPHPKQKTFWERLAYNLEDSLEDNPTENLAETIVRFAKYQYIHVLRYSYSYTPNSTLLACV
jgi:hypothetical protein